MKTESKKKVEDYDKKIRETNIKKNKKRTATNNLTIHTSSNLNNIGDNNKMTTNKFTTNTMNSNKGEMKTENSFAKRMNYQVPPPQRKAKTEEVETNNEDDENFNSEDNTDLYLKYENRNVTIYVVIHGDDVENYEFVAEAEDGEVITDYPFPSHTKISINRSTGIATDYFGQKYPIRWE